LPRPRRTLAVFIGSLGMEHPNSRIVAKNYGGLLQAMGMTEDEIEGRLFELGIPIK